VRSCRVLVSRSLPLRHVPRVGYAPVHALLFVPPAACSVRVLRLFVCVGCVADCLFWLRSFFVCLPRCYYRFLRVPLRCRFTLPLRYVVAFVGACPLRWLPHSVVTVAVVAVVRHIRCRDSLLVAVRLPLPVAVALPFVRSAFAAFVAVVTWNCPAVALRFVAAYALPSFCRLLLRS